MSIEPFYMLRMQACEEQLKHEMEREQVRHIDLAEYAVGSPHWERLWEQIRLAHRFTWPTHLTVNV